MNSVLERAESAPVAVPRAKHPASQPFKVGDALPMQLTVADMCRVFRISRSTFHTRERLGKFRKFELPKTGGCKRWSGARIQRFLDGPPSLQSHSR